MVYPSIQDPHQISIAPKSLVDPSDSSDQCACVCACTLHIIVLHGMLAFFMDFVFIINEVNLLTYCIYCTVEFFFLNILLEIWCNTTTTLPSHENLKKSPLDLLINCKNWFFFFFLERLDPGIPFFSPNWFNYFIWDIVWLLLKGKSISRSVFYKEKIFRLFINVLDSITFAWVIRNDCLAVNLK